MAKRTKKYYAPQNEDMPHQCDHPGCTEKGEYRAPKNRRLKEYYWFCLKHVQEYNAKWNYYEGEGLEDEAEEAKRKMHFRGGFSSKVHYLVMTYGTRPHFLMPVTAIIPILTMNIRATEFILLMRNANVFGFWKWIFVK